MTMLLLLSVLLQGGAGPGAATITGQVRMKDGTPAAGVRVAAMAAPRDNVLAAQGQNYYATQQPAAVALTDGDGRYRIAAPPGRYVIVAGLVGHGTFHPSATDIDRATVLDVEAGVTETVDVALLTFPGARVSGQITPAPASGAREYAAVAGVGLGEMLEAPVRPDGTFEFGRIPPGDYLLNVFPNPPGQASLPFRVEDRDVTSLQLVRPAVRTVSGRIAVEKGPLPNALFGFSTPQGYVAATINPDLTFNVGLHAARHHAELAGLPVGYEVRAVRVGAEDVTRTGIPVGARDVNDVTIEVAVRRELPTLRGRLIGAGPGDQPARIEVSGPIVGNLQATVDGDGTFIVPDVPPGTYLARVSGRSDVPPAHVVVTSTGGEVTIGLLRP